MKCYVVDLEGKTQANQFFRQVLFTAQHSQLVVMSLQPKEEIGMEVHKVDQFIRIEKGKGKSVLDGQEHELSDGFAVVIPAGTNHNIVNTSASEPMKLYTVYSPPQHPDGTVHKIKADALADEKD